MSAEIEASRKRADGRTADAASVSIGHRVGGRAEAGGARRSAVFNPATGEIIGETVLADRAQVDRAVAAAKEAFPAWSDTAPLKRARVLFRFKELLDANLRKDVGAVKRVRVIVGRLATAWETAIGSLKAIVPANGVDVRVGTPQEVTHGHAAG